MAAPAVVSVTRISANDIQFAEPKRNKQGGVSVSFKYNNQNVQFRFPQMNFPGGCLVKENENKDGSLTTSYTMSASLTGCDPYGQEPSYAPDDVSKAYNFLREFQERVIQAATENSAKWFGKKRGEESIRDSFNKFLSVSVDKTNDGWVPNGKYPPSFRYKLPVYDGKVCMEVIDDNGDDVNVTNPSDLPTIFNKGCAAKMVVQGSIYVIGQGFGVTWKPTYVQVSKRAKKSARDMFVEDEDDNEATVPVAGGAAKAFQEEEEEENQNQENTTTGETVDAATTPPPSAVSVDTTKPAPAAPAAPARRRKVA
jgi:hypothetical protein